MFCINCGAEITENDRFCKKCGTKTNNFSSVNKTIPTNRIIGQAVVFVIIMCIIVISAVLIFNSFQKENSDVNVFNNIMNFSSSVKYADGYDFSDGVAWAKTSENQWNCVDKKGKILLRLSESERPASNFSHGVALVKRADKTVELIDKSGKVISSPKSGEYDEIRGFILDLGMIVVYKKVVTFEITEDHAGIINNQGKWELNLCNEITLTKARASTVISMLHFGEAFRDSSIYSEDSYLGEGYFRNEGRIYNIFTGAWYEWNPVSSLNRIENGGSVFSYNSKVYSWKNTTWETELFDSAFAVLGKYKEELFYYSDKKNGGTNQGFYDINGKMIINLYEYDFSTYAHEYIGFTDGYCVLPLNNPQGTPFFTIIDKSGKTMFEPKIDNTEHRLVIKCGMLVLREKDKSFAVNISGETMVDLGKVNYVNDFYDDAAMVKNDGEIYYIDKTGKRLF
jgi:hypothetical protein